MKYINRTIEQKIDEMKYNFPVILITGARQSGKSTLLEYINNVQSEKINYVTLDNIIERSNAIEDPESFLRLHEAPLIIDEFQYAPNLLSYINKTEIDLLKKKEKLNYEPLENVFDRILRGSYPALYNQENMEDTLENFYSAYIKTYIERDIRELINIKDEIKFLKFISAIAARTSQEYNASDIGKDVGIDNKTVDEWMSILRNTFLVYLLQPYSNNTLSRVIKRPKIYLMDTGLACYLAGYLDARTLERSAYSGQIFETYIVSEIIKSYTNNARDPRLHLYYYRDNNQKEIDLLIVDQNNIYPVEIKKGANLGKDAIKNFNITKNFQMNSPNGVVLCLTKDLHAIDEKNYMVPIEYI